jgi:hypothetical protein
MHSLRLFPLWEVRLRILKHPSRADGDALHPWPALHSRPNQLAQPAPAGQELATHIAEAYGTAAMWSN